MPETAKSPHPWSPPIEALETFASRLPRASRIFCANDPQAASWLSARGFAIEPYDPARDLRMLSLPRESLMGAWLGNALTGFTIEDAQRIVASLFKALQPRSGMLFVAHSFSETGFESLLRQNGFEILNQGRRPPWQAVTARRI